MLFKRSDKEEWYTKIPVRGGGWKARSTGTTNKPAAKRIEEAVGLLHPKEGHGLEELLEAVHDGRISLLELGRDPRLAALKRVQRELIQEDLNDRIKPWHALVERDYTKDTADHYLVAVRSCFPEGHAFRAKDITRADLQEWVHGLDGRQNTRRKYAAGMSSFCRYLVSLDILESNPIRDVELPPLGGPRDVWLSTEDAERLVLQQEGDYRALSALMAGSGIEVSVALSLRARDVLAKVREVRARGTKTHARDRVIRVADWAWPYFMEAVEGKEKEDLIFGGIPDRWYARDAHSNAVADLVEKGYPQYAGYTMRDHRHTYAVRAIQAGTPVQVISKQLGHSNGVLVLRVYGKYAPDEQERARWEAVAAAMDQAKKEEKKALNGVSRGVRKRATGKNKTR